MLEFNITAVNNALLGAPLNTLPSLHHCCIFLHRFIPLSSAVFLSVSEMSYCMTVHPASVVLRKTGMLFPSSTFLWRFDVVRNINDTRKSSSFSRIKIVNWNKIQQLESGPWLVQSALTPDQGYFGILRAATCESDKWTYARPSAQRHSSPSLAVWLRRLKSVCAAAAAQFFCIITNKRSTGEFFYSQNVSTPTMLLTTVKYAPDCNLSPLLHTYIFFSHWILFHYLNECRMFRLCCHRDDNYAWPPRYTRRIPTFQLESLYQPGAILVVPTWGNSQSPDNRVRKTEPLTRRAKKAVSLLRLVSDLCK